MEGNITVFSGGLILFQMNIWQLFLMLQLVTKPIVHWTIDEIHIDGENIPKPDPLNDES